MPIHWIHKQLVRTMMASLLSAGVVLLQVPTAALANMSFTTTAGWRLLNVPQIFQTHGLSCEAAAEQMALAYQGVNVSQDALVSAMPDLGQHGNALERSL